MKAGKTENQFSTTRNLGCKITCINIPKHRTVDVCDLV